MKSSEPSRVVLATFVLSFFAVNLTGVALAHAPASDVITRPFSVAAHDEVLMCWAQAKFENGGSWESGRARIKDTADAWNAVGNNFKFITDNCFDYDLVNANDPDLCDDPANRNGYFARDYPNDGSIARTAYCPVNGYTTRYVMEFDTDYDWNQSTTASSTEYDVRGIAAHEHGHAAGGWKGTGWGHWDEYTEEGLCGVVVLSTDHTMCPYTNEALDSFWYSLESHDAHTLEQFYDNGTW